MPAYLCKIILSMLVLSTKLPCSSKLRSPATFAMLTYTLHKTPAIDDAYAKILAARHSGISRKLSERRKMHLAIKFS